MTTEYVEWGNARVKLTWNKTKQLPSRELVTSVHGFCFKDGELLLVNLNHRGWDFPGGHIELDESPEVCFQREAYEEGYVTGSCNVLGNIEVDHSENLNWDKNGPYPKVGYQVFYRMEIEKLLEFEAKYESAERILIQPQEVINYYANWNVLYQEILNAALSDKYLIS